MKKIFFFITFLFIPLLVLKNLYSSFEHPYGVNAWQFPVSRVNICQKWKDVHIDRWRVMCDWGEVERTDVIPPNTSGYDWNYAGLTMALDNAPSVGAKISVCVYGSPGWARSDSRKVFSYNPAKYCEFLDALLDYCDSRSPGTLEAIEVDNEHATGWWDSSIPITNGTDQRDPSQAYANILKAAYQTIKAHRSDIKVVMTGIWAGAYHLLDDLYQLGCKGYFDRLNFHYYVQGMGEAENPSNKNTIWHYPTVIRYLKYLAEQNSDPGPFLWCTEFGWRTVTEDVKANYYQYILDQSRKAGFIDTTYVYLGVCMGYPSNYDRMSLIYTDQDWDPTPSLTVYTTAYYMYEKYTNQYPQYNPANREVLDVIQGATNDVNVVNPGFESANTNGWTGVTLDSSQKHSGQYSGRLTGTVRTNFYSVETNRLYEVIVWVKINAANSDAAMLTPYVVYRNNGGNATWWGPPNYYGIVDTRNYPDGWRRIRYMYLSYANEMAVEFSLNGTATVWIDDISIKALKMPEPTIIYDTTSPLINVSPLTLDFGEIKIGEKSSLSFTIKNLGVGTLTGTITPSENWILVEPSIFNQNEINVNVTVDNSILLKKEGEYIGNIFIVSNGGNANVEVKLTATCVIAYPDPYEPKKGLLTFSGSGIVPGKTEICIWTLNGELVKKLIPEGSEVSWDGKDNNSKKVLPGIYIYTYSSEKEKGISKFTVR